MNKKIINYLSLFFLILINVFLDLNIKKYIEVLSKCFNKDITLTLYLYSIICAIIALISFLIYLSIKLLVLNKKDEVKGINLKAEDGTYGTANWLVDNEISNILGTNNEPGILLGKKNGCNVVLPFDSYFNKNILVIGSSGSGKSVAFAIPNILELARLGKSMIITDSKGKLYQETAYMLQKRGYKVRLLNLCDMAHSDRWNPLSEIENINDAQNAADIIISNTQKHNKKNSDDFWPRAEENLLKAFLLYFHERMIETNTLTNIYMKIASGDINAIDSMFASLSSDSPARMSYNIFAGGSDTIKASVLTGLGTRLQAFQNQLVQNLTSNTDIDLTLPAKEKCAYFVITSDMDTTYDFLSSLFYTFLFIKLIRYADSTPKGICNIEVFFLLDEFANIGAIPDFNKKISTCRSRNIAIIPIIQNIAQIKNRYPQDVWQEIIGNCDTRVCLGCTDTLTAEYISDLLGVSTAESQSIRKEAGIDGEFNYRTKEYYNNTKKVAKSR
ncbi:MAG: type IV secretory system conjugative DNA transfer family protein [Clostridia bacterium]|nr:type IV secretory system conjugative DNA transfer family protein [Clostridia bacterium]